MAAKGAGGAESSELDLTKPGKLWAKSENEAATTFHIVLPNPKYTKDSLKANPAVDAADQLMRPWTVAFKDVGKDGMAFCDLDASGRAAEIMERLTKLYEGGHPRVEKVKGLYIATAREGNRVPDSQLAEVKEFKLISIPSITLKPVIDYMTVPNFKGTCCACAKKGQKNFHVEMSVTGAIESVEVTSTPERDMKSNPGPGGKGRMTVPIKEGTKVLLHVSVPFAVRNEQRTTRRRRPYVHYVPGGWRSAGNADMVSANEKREVWDGGFITLRVAGTGAYKGIVKSLNLRAEAWASNWLWTNPPPPQWHNVC